MKELFWDFGKRAACTSRPADGNEALKGSQYAAALDAYRCGDTPEAAFGAGLTTLLTAIEAEPMTKVLGQLGQAGLKATDIASPNGWFARYLSRSKGTGSITRSDASGATIETVTLKVGRASTVSGNGRIPALVSPEAYRKQEIWSAGAA